MERKLILYIAMSLDGFIAKSDDDISFLSMVEEQGEDYGYNDFLKTVDAVILGGRTYDKVLSMGYDFPHADKDAYVISRFPRDTKGKEKFYSDDLKKLVLDLKMKKGKHVFIDGGAFVVNELLKDKLIDEVYISVIPIILGGGVRLFGDRNPEQRLELINCRSFKKGLVQMHYKVYNH